ncbi:hypothetical protein CRENBAI_015238 [Crenichthys baileyi]|uniref:Uncharacterized protein n=1 Tax=Crenichthys baileyi TaxID=28760 RepID=A0AAV9RCT5_9TELE
MGGAFRAWETPAEPLQGHHHRSQTYVSAQPHDLFLLGRVASFTAASLNGNKLTSQWRNSIMQLRRCHRHQARRKTDRRLHKTSPSSESPPSLRVAVTCCCLRVRLRFSCRHMIRFVCLKGSDLWAGPGRGGPFQTQVQSLSEVRKNLARERLRIPQNELKDVAGKRNVWVFLLDLLPL